VLIYVLFCFDTRYIQTIKCDGQVYDDEINEMNPRNVPNNDTLIMYTQMSDFKMKQHAIGTYRVTPAEIERSKSKSRRL